MQPGDKIAILEANHGRTITAEILSVDASTGTAIVDVGPLGWQPLENPAGQGAAYKRRYCRIDCASCVVLAVVEAP